MKQFLRRFAACFVLVLTSEKTETAHTAQDPKLHTPKHVQK